MIWWCSPIRHQQNATIFHFKLSNLCSSNLATSRRLILFSSIKQVTPLASFSSGFRMPVAERTHLLFLWGKIVHGITTTLPTDPLITHKTFGRWSFVTCASSWQYSHLVFIRSVIGRGITCICAGCCLHSLSLMFTNLSLASSETMLEQTVGWPGPTMGRRSFTWRSFPSTVIFCTLVIPVTRPTLYFVVHCPCGVFTHTRSPGLKMACCWLFHWFLSAVCGTDRPYWLVLWQRIRFPLAWRFTSILLLV